MGARHHRLVEGEEYVIGGRNSEHVVRLCPLGPGITPGRAEDRAGWRGPAPRRAGPRA